MALNIGFSNDTSDPIRGAIAAAIWGEDDKAGERIQRLMKFFEYYRRETITAAMAVPKDSGLRSIQTHAELIEFISLLKENPLKARQELRSHFQSVGSHKISSAATDMDAALDLTVRLMFMTACRSQNAYNFVSTTQIFRPRWKEQESLEQFVERVFPRCEPPEQGSRDVTIRAHKFAAHYLKQYVDIQIQWTDHLSDHLVFQKGDSWKSLYVFRHPSVIEVASKALAEYELDTSTNIALSL
jgi:hypothetical protein